MTVVNNANTDSNGLSDDCTSIMLLTDRTVGDAEEVPDKDTLEPQNNAYTSSHVPVDRRP